MGRGTGEGSSEILQSGLDRLVVPSAPRHDTGWIKLVIAGPGFFYWTRDEAKVWFDFPRFRFGIGGAAAVVCPGQRANEPANFHADPEQSGCLCAGQGRKERIK